MTYLRSSLQSGFQERIRSVAQTFKFYLEIQGVLVGEFLECGGLSMERDTYAIPEGGVNDFVAIRPGKMKPFPNLTLKRGLTYDRDLWDWFRKGMYDGRVERKNLSVIIGNADFMKVKQWDIYDAFPVKWSLIDLNASTMEIAWESIELVHHGMELSAVEGLPIGAGLRDAAYASTAAGTAALAAERTSALAAEKDAAAARAAAAEDALKKMEALAAENAAAQKEAKALEEARAADAAKAKANLAKLADDGKDAPAAGAAPSQ